MTIRYNAPLKGRTRFGVFHNLDTPQEGHGYIMIHLFSASLEIIWERK